MTLTGIQLLTLDDPQWFCLKAQPKREHFAAAALRQLAGLEVLSPRIRFRKATRRGPVWFVEAMFPGYLFARFVYRDQHRHVRSMPGVSKLVNFGDHIGILDAQTIANLRTATGAGETLIYAPLPQVGDTVKIAVGVFSGLEAVITQLFSAKERVKILLEFLGRNVEAEIACPSILPQASPRSVYSA